MNGKGCCLPNADRDPLPQSAPAVATTEPAPAQIEVCAIPGGQAIVGTHHPVIPLDEEGPRRKKKIKAFHMMKSAVTNALFAAFVEDTGFVTEAERYGWSYVFHHNVSGAVRDTLGAEEATWWRRVDGAYWRAVNGPDSEHSWQADHPVVHVSWNDAVAFADWAGGRLPTEAEWEHAARGGLGDIPFPWGYREPDDDEFQPCNIWQGNFPHTNSALDGYTATAPAVSFEPNGFGLYNMCGNVWEWTAEPLVLR
ncbi:MAG: SUMF1/EgtB/PvdO family nonheme iron enzyme, partial [Pseudomonadota bacterium]